MNSVEKTYDKIAKDFNRTRYKVWNRVARFLDDLEPNTRVLEVGCGNGKNMLYRNDLQVYGIDISDEYLVNAENRMLNVSKKEIEDIENEMKLHKVNKTYKQRKDEKRINN